MIAHISRVRFNPGAVDEATAVLHERGLPALRRMLGFRTGLWLHDPGTGDSVQITLWETEADLQAAVASGAAEEIAPVLAPLVVEEGPDRTYEVTHWERER